MRRLIAFKKLLLITCGWLIAFTALAQEKPITGQVIDGSTNEPLIGATVIVKGTTTGATTDLDGNFTINVKDGDVLVASFVGYLSEEVIISGQSTVNFGLIPDLQALEEVVVIGYGTVKKADATGAVSAVSSKDFNKGAITSPQDLLVGKSAGVVITSNGGAPGSGSTIRIRGGSSLQASNDPLIIVDGIPISNNNVGGSSNLLSFVNPNDIETFTVLKDASATAIYGSRASNGVILITTKKGAKGKPLTVGYNGNVSVATPISYIDVYSGDEFRQIALQNRDIYDQSVYDLLGTENTDWQKEIFQNAISHDHNISVSGAAGDFPYRASIGYSDQNGILKNTDMQRVTGTFNLNPSFLDNTLKFNANGKIMNTKHNFGDQGAIGSAIAMDPTQPIKDGNEDYDGYFQWPTYGANLGTPNPVEQALSVDNSSDVFRFVGNFQVDYTMPFLPELRANLNMATDYSNSVGHDNRPVTSPSVLTNPYVGRLRDYSETFKNNLLDFYLNYAKDITASQRLDVTAGYSWQHFEREGSNYRRGVIDTTDATPDSSSFITENYLVSFFGRANYSLMNKYLFTATVRMDGSSRFAEGNQWGIFPSAAFAWKINEEAFLVDVDAVSELKLRLGWGITGQQDISDSDYPAQALYRESSPGSYYPINGEYLPTLRPDAYDPNIKWEETTTYNIGIDYGFYNGRINGSVDVYQRETKDLLNRITIPTGSNFSNTLVTNVGSLENRGIELAINFIPVSTQDQNLTLGFNFAYNENKVTKLIASDDPDFIGILYGDAFTGQKQVTRVGYPAYSFFVNQQVYYPDGSPIEGMYVDLAGTGGAVGGDNNQKYIYNNPAPDYTIGFNFRYSYKQFDLSGSARANIGNYVYNQIGAGASYDQMQQIGYWRNMPKYLSDHNFVKRQFTSDYFVENASFLKIDNLSAGYTFENIAADKLSLRVNFTVQNAVTWSKYKGVDPEVDGGIDNNFYPRPRTFMLGLSLNY